MYCSYANYKRRARWALLHLALAYILLLSTCMSAHAATLSSPKPNTLFVTATTPAGFQNELCIQVMEQSTEKTFTLKFDCLTSLSTNLELANGDYKITGVYAERHRDQYEVTCDMLSFTIGDDSAPAVSIVVSARNQTTTVTPSASPTAEEPTEEDTAGEEVSGSEPELQAEEETTSEPTISGDTSEEDDTSAPSGGILRTFFYSILGVFLATLLFSALAVYLYIRRDRD